MIVTLDAIVHHCIERKNHMFAAVTGRSYRGRGGGGGWRVYGTAHERQKLRPRITNIKVSFS